MGQAAAQFVPQAAAATGESFNTLLGFRQTDRAADDLTRRQEEANALYRQQLGTTEQQYQPYLAGGRGAFEALLATYGIGGAAPNYADFYNSPDYQFALQQGQAQLDRQAAARGGLYSGNQLRAAQQFGQGLASTQLDNYRRGLYNISNQGLGATNALSGFRQGYTNTLGQGITNLGDIAAAERMGIYAVNSRHNANMQNIHGVGGGGGGLPQMGGGQSSYGDTGSWTGNALARGGFTDVGTAQNDWMAATGNWGG